MTDGRFTIGLVASEEMSALRRTTDAIAGSTLIQRRDDTILTDAGARQVTSFGVSEGFFDLFGLPMSAADGASRMEDYRRHAGAAAWSCRSARGARCLAAIRASSARRFGSRAAARWSSASPPTAFAIPREADLWFAQHNSESIGHMFDAFVRFRPGCTPAAISGAAAADVGRPREEVSRSGKEPHLRDASAARHDGRRSRSDRPHRLCGDGSAAAAGDGQRRQPDARARHDARARDRRAHRAWRDAVGYRAAAAGRVAAHCASPQRPLGLPLASACRARNRRDGRHSAAARRRHAARSARLPVRSGRHGDCRHARRIGAGRRHGQGQPGR